MIGCDGIVYGNKYGFLGQLVNDYEDGCGAQKGGKLLNEVHEDGIPWSFGDQELFEQSVGVVTRGFSSGTGGAGFDVVLDVLLYTWPSISKPAICLK